jgi:cyanophycinase
MKISATTRAFRCTIPTLALALAASGCSARSQIPVERSAAVARGHLLIVGGGPIPRDVTETFVRLARRNGPPRIGVMPMASAVASTGPEKVEELNRLGAEAFVLDVRRPVADADSVVRIVDGTDAIWFSGGVQDRIMTAIGSSKTADAIRRAYERGAVIAGTSAGAAVMSGLMITGDERRPGGTRGDTSQVYITIDRDNVITSPGLGLLSTAIVDQHFVRRKRNNRLVSLALEHPTLIAVGIDESTAILVKPDGMWEVLGESVAVIFDARKSRVTPQSERLGASGVAMHVLTPGSLFDPVAGRVLRLGSRTPP